MSLTITPTTTLVNLESGTVVRVWEGYFLGTPVVALIVAVATANGESLPQLLEVTRPSIETVNLLIEFEGKT